jgi:tetratricopeptide (TPR) repeat protein
MYRLKRLPSESVGQALTKADHYRELNQPEEAESICRDVLEIDAANQVALKLLGLSLTDQFPRSWTSVFDEALGVFERLTNEYERTYYAGIAYERCAKAQLEHGQAHNAVASFETALDFFERAEKLAPAGSEADPVLRWNRCVRMLTTHPDLREANGPARGSQHSVLGD